MKLILLSVLCLSLFLFHINFSFAYKKKTKAPTPSRDSTYTKTNSDNRNDKGTTSQGGRLNPPKSGRPGQRPGDGGYYNQNPARGSPYGRGYRGHGGYKRRYGGGYVNRNPANKIPSPYYSDDFGYGGYSAGGGSPFSRSVNAMGVYPSDQSRGFGRTAVAAAAGGALAGTAVGYGLGSAPHPHFELHSPQEEYYYKQYMHKKQATQNTRSTATKTSRENSYSDPPRENSYSDPPQSYDTYMESCMKRTDPLPAENQPKQPNNKPAATPTATQTAAPSTTDNSTGSNNTAADNSSSSAPSTSHHANQTKVNRVPPTSQNLTNVGDDDDTVSIAEIGYPALIKQQNLRRCLEMYMVYTDDYWRTKGGVQGLEMGSQRFLAVATSTILMLVNSNMLMLLRRGP